MYVSKEKDRSFRIAEDEVLGALSEFYDQTLKQICDAITQERNTRGIGVNMLEVLQQQVRQHLRRLEKRNPYLIWAQGRGAQRFWRIHPMK